MSVRKQLHLIMTVSDTEPVGLLVAGSICLWGLWMLNPLSSTFAGTRLYQPLLQTGLWLQSIGSPLDPEVFWGLLICSLGAVHLYGVLVGSAWLRRWGAFSTFGLRLIPWLSIVYSGAWMLPVFVDASALMLAPLWIYWRLSAGRPRGGR